MDALWPLPGKDIPNKYTEANNKLLTFFALGTNSKLKRLFTTVNRTYEKVL